MRTILLMAPIIASIIMGIPAGIVAQSVSLSTITGVRTGAHPTHTRIVFDLTQPTAYEVQTSPDGRELRVTMLAAVPASGLPATVTAGKSPHFSAIHLSQPTSTATLAIVQLKGSPTPQLFILQNPDRIVLDLHDAPTTAPPEKTGPTSAQTPSGRLQPTAASPASKVIVIDPGHGGKDPGAIGRKGLQEKEMVLDIGHRLRRLLERQGHKVVMTRKDDTFISLDDRATLANDRQADLFISIHANASPKRNVSGVEIYLLGRATDADARATAARENGGDAARMNDLEQIFSDMALDYRINHSILLAHQTRDAFVRTVGREYRVNDLGVKRAPFYVLMKSSMPSILAEVSFISNPAEEARLGQPAYRQKVAEALREGIQQYLAASALQS